MAAKPRDYAKEYRLRVERGIARGLSKAQARGHPSKKAQERLASAISGRPLRGAAKRAQAARAAREAPARAILQPTLPWSRATPGGTRDFTTADPELIRRALEEARGEGKDVLVSVLARTIDYGSYDRKRNPNDEWAHSGRTSPEEALSEIAASDGDAEAGIALYILRQTGTAVSGILRYRIKKFAD